jgi:hypothetical protein
MNSPPPPIEQQCSSTAAVETRTIAHRALDLIPPSPKPTTATAAMNHCPSRHCPLLTVSPSRLVLRLGKSPICRIGSVVSVSTRPTPLAPSVLANKTLILSIRFCILIFRIYQLCTSTCLGTLHCNLQSVITPVPSRGIGFHASLIDSPSRTGILVASV